MENRRPVWKFRLLAILWLLCKYKKHSSNRSTISNKNYSQPQILKVMLSKIADSMDFKKTLIKNG